MPPPNVAVSGGQWTSQLSTPPVDPSRDVNGRQRSAEVPRWLPSGPCADGRDRQLSGALDPKPSGALHLISSGLVGLALVRDTRRDEL